MVGLPELFLPALTPRIDERIARSQTPVLSDLGVDSETGEVLRMEVELRSIASEVKLDYFEAS